MLFRSEGWLGLRLGDLALGWDNGWSWPGGPAPVCSPPTLGSLWMLVVAAGQLQLVVDGLLLFSGPFDASALTTVCLDTGSGSARLRNLGLFRAPRLQVTWSDGTAQARQQQYRWGADARVSQAVCDALGRTVALTRMAPGSCAPATACAPLAFRPDFVDESAFLASLDSSWAMTGALADYYADEDGAFPYSGTRYESSPRKRKLEQGAPSEALAITRVDTTSVQERATTSWQYGATALGAGSVAQHTQRDPLGREIQTTLASPRRPMEARTIDASGVSTARSRQVTSYASAADGVVRTSLLQNPNGGGTDVPSSDSSFVSRSVLNPLGQQLQRGDCDTGTTRFWYSTAGQMRFAAPALDAGEQGRVYQRYDARGRLVELGSLDTSVEDSTLAAHVDDMTWPDSTVAHTVVRRWDWDGDGGRAAELGQITRVTTQLAAPEGFTKAATVTESFTHGAQGHVVRADLDVSADTSFQASIAYGYNTQGELVELRLPQGSPLEAVHYGYNDQGQVETIGSSPGADDIARYTYSPDGVLQTEQRGGGRIVGTWSWTGAGWPLGVSLSVDDAPVWSQTLGRDVDGSVSGYLETWAGEREVQWTCTYDDSGRLSRCQPDQGLGDEQITVYDANGNILGARLDDATLSATLDGQSNRLGSVTLGGATHGVTTTAAGDVSAWGDYSAVTQRCLGQPVRAARGQTVVRLAYGTQGQRVLRQVQGGSTRFVHCGAGSAPLLWNTDGAVSVAVWGPSGLVMVADAGGRCFPVADALGTVHGLLDASGSRVARWDWSAFGSLVASEGDTGRLFLGYQGHEWDPDLGVHDFMTRLYDPTLRRFLAPDPARQYASPYVFVGGDPLSNTDASGQVSTAKVAVGVATVAIVAVSAVGFALSLVTAGGSDAVAASVDAALLEGEVDADAVLAETSLEGADLLEEDGADLLSQSDEKISESNSKGASKVSSGVDAGAEETGEAASGAAKSAKGPNPMTWKQMPLRVAKAGARGSMRSAIKYNIKGVRSGDWSFTGLLGSALWGASLRMAGGLLSGTMELGLQRVLPRAKGLMGLRKLVVSSTLAGVSGVVVGDIGQVVSNARNNQPLYSHLGYSSALGFDNGFMSAAVCGSIIACNARNAAYSVAVSATVISSLGMAQYKSGTTSAMAVGTH